MITAFAFGAAAAAAVGLPVDYLRRRTPGPVTLTAGAVSALVLIGIVAVLTGAHVLTSGLAIPALVLGLVAGNVAADALASRAWGPAGRRA